MKIDVSVQAKCDPSFPLKPVRTLTGSALPLDVVGLPRMRGGATVATVSAHIVNANGIALDVPLAFDSASGEWHSVAAASNFATYGQVENGFRLDLTLSRADGTTFVERFAVGRFEVVASSASAHAGSMSACYVAKGDRLFLRSRQVDGEWHYVEQVMEYDPAIGWGATWSGDYILSGDGEFVNQEEA